MTLVHVLGQAHGVPCGEGQGSLQRPPAEALGVWCPPNPCPSSSLGKCCPYWIRFLREPWRGFLLGAWFASRFNPTIQKPLKAKDHKKEE